MHNDLIRTLRMLGQEPTLLAQMFDEDFSKLMLSVLKEHKRRHPIDKPADVTLQVASPTLPMSFVPGSIITEIELDMAHNAARTEIHLGKVGMYRIADDEDAFHLFVKQDRRLPRSLTPTFGGTMAIQPQPQQIPLFDDADNPLKW